MGDPITSAMPGARIRAVREALGLSQVALADLLGVSNVTVNRWERNKATPQPATIDRLLRLEHGGFAALGQTPLAASGNLPRTVGPLIGRAADLAVLTERLRGSPLLTISGPAGAGKTRLAIETARSLAPEWPDGIWFVDLAAASDPGDVEHALARVLGVREAGRKPLRDRLADEVRARSLLLVLDNCEHLLEACAAQVARLTAGDGGTRLITTSRVPLGVAGETVYPLRPLTIDDAATLFLHRAREHHPALAPDDGETAAIAEICRRLDGLPLAIELAAARAQMLSVEQIADRLDRRFELLRVTGGGVPRQRALDTAIAWSCDLLDPESAVLFRRLGVFAGWFDLEAVAAVAARSAALDRLGDLARQSMIVVEHDPATRAARYRLLESLAAYARDWLARAGEAEAATRRHAAYYGDLAAGLARGLQGPRQATLLAQLDRDHDNFIAALEWNLAAGEAAAAVALVAALGPYWRLRGRYAEGSIWLRRALVPEGAADAGPRTGALNELALLQYHAGQFDEALPTLDAAIALAHGQGDQVEEARALDTLGLVLAARRELERAAAAHEASLALALAAGARGQAALSRLHLGNLANLRGDHKTAERGYHDAWSLIQGTGDSASEALILSNLGEIAARTGRYTRALGYYERTLRLLQAVGDPDRLAAVATNTAEVQLVLGHAAAALPLASEAVARYREIHHPAHLADALYVEAAAFAAVGQRHAASVLFREMLALEQEHRDWIDSVYAIEAIARLVAEEGDAPLAARLLGGLETIRERHQVADYPLFDLAGTVAVVRTTLGRAAMATHWAEGRLLSGPEIVTEAMLAGDVADGAPVRLLTAREPAQPFTPQNGSLTPRQVDVLRQVAAGQSNREIGEALAISGRTVERHLTAIFSALDVDRRSAAVARAIALGLIDGAV